MSWLSDFLGGPDKVEGIFKPAENLETFDEFEIDSYLRDLSKRSGFTDTIIAGRKKPKLSLPSLLG